MENTKKGFTLLELLIVIAIIVLLGIILIFALNPAETLAKSRDAQRISDLATLKTAIAVYATTVSPVVLGVDADCLAASGAANTTAVVHYSKGTTDVSCVANTLTPGAEADASSDYGDAVDTCHYVTAANASLTNGSGWLPIDLASITGGSPISALPLDPVNEVATDLTPLVSDYVYRYACQLDAPGTLPDFVFELAAVLESTTYAVTDNLDANDGGDNDAYYEVGTSVQLLPTEATNW